MTKVQSCTVHQWNCLRPHLGHLWAKHKYLLNGLKCILLFFLRQFAHCPLFCRWQLIARGHSGLRNTVFLWDKQQINWHYRSVRTFSCFYHQCLIKKNTKSTISWLHFNSVLDVPVTKGQCWSIQMRSSTQYRLKCAHMWRLENGGFKCSKQMSENNQSPAPLARPSYNTFIFF